jgi:hypothetical protein
MGTFATVGFGVTNPRKPTLAHQLRDLSAMTCFGNFRCVGFSDNRPELADARCAAAHPRNSNGSRS